MFYLKVKKTLINIDANLFILLVMSRMFNHRDKQPFLGITLDFSTVYNLL